MLVEKPKTRAKRPYKFRDPADGNLLWSSYSDLKRSERAAFLELLANSHIPYDTFISDTAATRRLRDGDLVTVDGDQGVIWPAG